MRPNRYHPAQGWGSKEEEKVRVLLRDGMVPPAWSVVFIGVVVSNPARLYGGSFHFKFLSSNFFVEIVKPLWLSGRGMRKIRKMYK
jgi:hypothetical protein